MNGFRLWIARLAALLVAGSALAAQETPEIDIRFRLLGLGVRAESFYYVQGDEVKRVDLPNRRFSDARRYRGPQPLALYRSEPPVDRDRAEWPAPFMRLRLPSDESRVMVLFFPGAGEDYRTTIFPDDIAWGREGSAIRMWNLTTRPLGVRLGEELKRVGPRETITWSNPEGKRRAFVVLVERGEGGDLQRLKSGYVRLAPYARSLVFVAPTARAEREGEFNVRLFQIFDLREDAGG